MELNRSGELGGAACCWSGVAGWMVVRRAGAALGAGGGGEDGVSMSIAGCYGRGGVDPCRFFQNFCRWSDCESESGRQNSAPDSKGGGGGGGPLGGGR